MATMAEFGVEFKVNGSKATLAEMEKIIKKMEELNKANKQQAQNEDEENRKNKKKIEQLEDENEEYTEMESSLDKLGNTIWKLGKRFLTLATLITIAKKSLDMFAKGQDVKFMANSANMGTRAFQQWEYVAQRYGGNAGSISSAMQNIDMQIENAKYGQVPMQEIAARYGVTLPSGGSAEQFLKVIAKKMESMDRRSQLAMGRAFGFDEATIRMLQLGLKGLTEELEKAKEKVIYDQENIEKADEFRKKMVEVRREFEKLTMLLGSESSDFLIGFLKSLAEVIKGVSSIIPDWIKNWFGNEKEKGTGEKIGEGIFDFIYNIQEKSDQITKRNAAGDYGSITRKLVKGYNGLQPLFPYLIPKIFDDVVAVSTLGTSSLATNMAGATFNNDFQITIDGAQDPTAVAGAIKNVFYEQTNKSIADAGIGFTLQEQ